MNNTLDLFRQKFSVKSYFFSRFSFVRLGFQSIYGLGLGLVSTLVFVGCVSQKAYFIDRGKMGQINSVEISNDIFFEYGSSYLSSEGKIQLQQITQAIQKQENMIAQLIITGHSDRLGDVEFNNWLSERRANRIVHYFKTHSIKVPMHSFGKGSTQSKTQCTMQAYNELVDCLAPDRRTEIQLIK